MRSVFLRVIISFATIAFPAYAQTVLVKPYVQPGDATPTSDAKVLYWLTDQTPGDFAVEYEVAGVKKTAQPKRVALDFAKLIDPKMADPQKPGNPDDPLERVGGLPVEREQHYFRYAAVLPELPLDSVVKYRVSLAGATVREAGFPLVEGDLVAAEREGPANADVDALPSVWPVRGFRHDVEPLNFAARLGLYSFDAGTPLTAGTWAAAEAGAAWPCSVYETAPSLPMVTERAAAGIVMPGSTW